MREYSSTATRMEKKMGTEMETGAMQEMRLKQLKLSYRDMDMFLLMAM